MFVVVLPPLFNPFICNEKDVVPKPVWFIFSSDVPGTNEDVVYTFTMSVS